MPQGLKTDLEALADEAGVSTNSLICSMLYGVVKHAHIGTPMWDGPFLMSAVDAQAEKPLPMWIGESGEPSEGSQGSVWFEIILGAPPQMTRQPMRITDREIS